MTPERAKLIQSEMSFQRSIGKTGESDKNGVLAFHTVEEELENHSTSLFFEPLSDRQRDVLIQHGRQDAAHALLNSISTIKSLRFLTVVVVLQLALTVSLVVFFW